ncbi:MAG: sulfatase [Puniceicoccaceae bacterium 5H]|nr:MAG: sulfatase [Puniceicoccaceae bacterium 5H]
MALVFTVAGLLLGLVGCGKEAGPPPNTNVVLIVADDLGYGDLGSYGQAQIQTPNLDRLAAQGVRFTQAYAGSSVCAPARCALFTGRHLGHAVVRGNYGLQPLPEGIGTLGNLMQQSGYATGLVGKWDLGPVGTSGAPNQQGFGHFFGYDNFVAAHNYWPAFLWWNDQQVPLHNEVRTVEVGYSEHPGSVATQREQYSPDLIAEAARKFVAADENRPFFLVWTPTIPHANNEAGQNGLEVPDDAPYSDRDWPQVQRDYAAMVTRLDAQVGQLLDQLETSGLADRTLVIFTSDNGPHREGGNDPTFFDSNGPFRGFKRDLYEGGIRVPLIVWGAGVDEGRVDDTPVAAWDFWSTFHAMTGQEGDLRDGAPLPLWHNPSPAYDRPLYWEAHENPKARAVRFGDWKLIDFFDEGRRELYNLADDPAEQHDLAAEEPERVQQGLTWMQQMRTPSNTWPLLEAQ